MPELPEVETTRQGISPFLVGAHVKDVVIRDSRLRWNISANLPRYIKDQNINQVSRRGKYIIVWMPNGSVIIHLGMSGSLRLVKPTAIPEKHDHYDIVLDTGLILRYRDPRRFGSIHWTRKNPHHHRLLKFLGPEPLSDEFTGEYLYQSSRNKILKVKSLIMNSRVVPGVGNIYANESLFHARIRPGIRAGRISSVRYKLLADGIKKVLVDAIKLGGTSLRDFVDSSGKPGYFQQSLYVYGRAGQGCLFCGNKIKSINLGQRATFYCANCQT